MLLILATTVNCRVQLPGLPGDAAGLLDLYGDARNILLCDELPNRAVPNTLQIFVSTPDIVNLDLTIAKFSRVEMLYHWLYEIEDDGAVHNLLEFKADEEQVIEGMNKDMTTMKKRLDIEGVREQIAMEARDNMKSHEDEHGKEGVAIKSPEVENILNGTAVPRMDGDSELIEFNCRAEVILSLREEKMISELWIMFLGASSCLKKIVSFEYATSQQQGEAENCCLSMCYRDVKLLTEEIVELKLPIFCAVPHV